MLSYGATRTFQKQYLKLPAKVQEQFQTRLKIFLTDRADPVLSLHPLKGKYKGCWSINISGDVRALFYWEGEKVVMFALIGTHSELYG